MLDNIAQKTLPNGLKVICLKKSDTPIVSVQLWYKTGSFYERDGIRGISHFLEHMMFRGTSWIKSEEHSGRISELGGHCNAFTAEDVTAFFNSVPKDGLDMVLRLEADRMDGLLLDPDIFEAERGVLTEEYHTYMNNPVTKAFLEFRREFFGTYPYADSPLGRIEDTKSVTVDDCREYYHSFYVPQNANLVVVGDFESEERIFEKAQKWFGSKSGSVIKQSADAAKFKHTQKAHEMERRVDFDVPVLVCGFPAPHSSHKDALPLEILQIVLSGGESGRLYREMVRKKSIVIMVGGMNQMFRYAGMSMFFAIFTPDIPVSKVRAELGRQIDIVKKDGITAQEFQKVKNATLTNRTFELHSAEHIAQRIGYGEALEGDYRLWVSRLDKLKHLNRDELVEAAVRYWDSSKMHSLYLKPQKVSPGLFVAGFFRRIFGRK
ncbi:MAG: insulinase family protein [Chitinispirillales bacterium]|jgi:zinc protease|nr:insulinase family protein [Chitinispirillales bacterium]